MSSAKDLNLKRKIELHYAIADKKSQNSLEAYLDQIIINSSPEPKRFGTIMTDVQRNYIFKPLIPAIESICWTKRKTPEYEEYKGVNRFMYILSKSWDKSSSQSRLINYMLAYSKRPVPLKIYSAAANLDQSNIILDGMRTEAKLNPWLNKHLTFVKNECKGSGGHLKCLTSDADSVAGILPDVIVIDEPTRHDSDFLYKELMAASGKRKGCLIIVISNAGVKGSWMWDEYQNAKAGNGWYLYESTQQPPWVDLETIANVRKSMLPDAARRLYDNIWTEENEASYVLRSEVQACEDLGKELQLTRNLSGDKNFVYYCGVDYGSVKDRTALCVLHYDYSTDRIIIDKLDVWQGSPTDRVKIKDVEDWMMEQYYDFNNPIFICDKYQMEGSIQKLESTLRIQPFEYRGGKKNYEMAELIRSLIVNKKIAWYPHCGDILVAGKTHSLSDELVELVIKRMSYGYRFDHQADKHDDRVVSIGMAALSAVKDRFVNMPEFPVQTNKQSKEINPLDKLNDFNKNLNKTNLPWMK